MSNSYLVFLSNLDYSATRFGVIVQKYLKFCHKNYTLLSTVLRLNLILFTADFAHSGRGGFSARNDKSVRGLFN